MTPLLKWAVHVCACRVSFRIFIELEGGLRPIVVFWYFCEYIYESMPPLHTVCKIYYSVCTCNIATCIYWKVETRKDVWSSRVFNTEGWVQEGDVPPPTHNIKLKIMGEAWLSTTIPMATVYQLIYIPLLIGQWHRNKFLETVKWQRNIQLKLSTELTEEVTMSSLAS